MQLEVEERSLNILKTLIRQRERNLTIANHLSIRVIVSDITSSSFTPRKPFPDTFDGTSTDGDRDGDIIVDSCFTAGDKVAIQA